MLFDLRSAKRSAASLRVSRASGRHQALVACMVALGGLASGCDRPSAGEASALREAQQLVLGAADAVPTEGQSLLSARLNALSSAAERVTPIADSEDPERRGLALGLLAEIASARAQALGLAGNHAAALLRADLSRLLAAVESAELDSARAEKLRLDPAPAIAKLQEAETQSAGELQLNRAELERITQRRSVAEEAIAEAQRERATAASEEAALADTAFLQGGDEKQQTLVAADQARSRADAAESREREARIELDQLNREAELATLRSELARGGTERLREVSRSFSEAGVSADAAVTEAQRSAAAAAAAAAEMATALHAGVVSRALEPLGQATEAAATAAERLATASVEPAVLAEAQLAHAQAIADAAGVAGAFSKALGDASSRLTAVAPSAGQTVAQLAANLQQEAEQRLGAASAALSTGVESLQAASPDAPGASTLREVASRLDSKIKASAG